MASPAPDRSARERAAAFCRRFGLRVPILMAPMAGARCSSSWTKAANKVSFLIR